MISLFSSNDEFERVSQAYSSTSQENNDVKDTPAIIRNVSGGYGESNRFYRRARQIYDRAVLTEQVSQQQTA